MLVASSLLIARNDAMECFEGERTVYGPVNDRRSSIISRANLSRALALARARTRKSSRLARALFNEHP